MTVQEIEYKKGFNDGYLLSMHEPELLEKLLKSKSDHEYMQGLAHGKKQLEKELELEKLKLKSKGQERER